MGIGSKEVAQRHMPGPACVCVSRGGNEEMVSERRAVGRELGSDSARGWGCS